MASSSSFRYLLFLLWLCFVFASCLLIFTGGFLLRRQVLESRAPCLASGSCNGKAAPRVFDKAVVIVIDALKYDFVLHDASLAAPAAFQNRLPVIDELARSGRGRVFEFRADPPTTTMQRLKGLTTGSLPHLHRPLQQLRLLRDRRGQSGRPADGAGQAGRLHGRRHLDGAVPRPLPPPLPLPLLRRVGPGHGRPRRQLVPLRDPPRRRGRLGRADRGTTWAWTTPVTSSGRATSRCRASWAR